jgi:hypothetical protein
MKNKRTITTSGVLLTVAFLFSCAPVRISGVNVETIYSDLVQGEETGDCAGYTVGITKISSGRLEIYFTDHEGSCKLRTKGTLIKIITLHPLVIVVEGFYASASEIRRTWDTSPCDGTGN